MTAVGPRSPQVCSNKSGFHVATPLQPPTKRRSTDLPPPRTNANATTLAPIVLSGVDGDILSMMAHPIVMEAAAALLGTPDLLLDSVSLSVQWPGDLTFGPHVDRPLKTHSDGAGNDSKSGGAPVGGFDAWPYSAAYPDSGTRAGKVTGLSAQVGLHHAKRRTRQAYFLNPTKPSMMRALGSLVLRRFNGHQRRLLRGRPAQHAVRGR